MIQYFIISLIIYLVAYQAYWYSCKPDFSGKTVFITGASSGIGEQLTKLFVKFNARKIIISARRRDELERVKKECESIIFKNNKKSEQEIQIQILDLNNPEQCLQFASTFKDKIDILINNGGIYQRDLFENSNMQVLQQIMNVNFFSPVALVKGFLPHLKKYQNEAQIINILSLAGLIGVPLSSYYSASKFALDGFGKALQAEIAQFNINVLQIYPGYVRTNISVNALTGNGNQQGKTDKNIENGISVEEACDDIIKAIYLRRTQVFICRPFVSIVSKLIIVSEILQYYFGIYKFNVELNTFDQDKKSQ